MDATCSGCADHCVIPEYCLVKKPKTVSHIDCAAVMEPGILVLPSCIKQNSLQRILFSFSLVAQSLV